MSAGLHCANEARRALVREQGQSGIDFVEVDNSVPSLCVRLFGKVPDNISAAQVRIEGGRRIRDLKVVSVTFEHDADDVDHEDCLRVVLDKLGDFSPYRVRLIALSEDGRPKDDPPPGFDRRYASAEFRFRLDCPTELDCVTSLPACPPAADGVSIDYLAKDYASFRRLVLDRLAVAMPDWAERHAADIGITLVELLAYVGDYLSYYQDAVATEAYLATSRLRVSVRRHGRLVDYLLHEGCNARVFLVLSPELADIPDFDLSQVYFVTSANSLVELPAGVVSEAALSQVSAHDVECFEPLHEPGAEVIALSRALNAIEIYTWGDTECVLCKGSTRATLVRTWSADQPLLKVGDLLLFEELRGPRTGSEADADPQHRAVVRLSEVAASVDDLTKTELLEIAWDADDALPFDLTLSALLPAPECSRVTGLSIARGNVILADHGCRFEDDLGCVGAISIPGDCTCPGSQIEQGQRPEPVRPALQTSSVLYRQALVPGASASALLEQDPRRALPILRVVETEADTAAVRCWLPLHDLLSSGPHARNFVLEVEEDRSAKLRFGDGDCGAQPEAGSALRAHYRAGDPLAGNVQAETITRIVARQTFSAALSVRNPLPARGGVAPEALATAKLAIPHAFKRERQRAINAEDYAEIAAREPGLQRAAADLAWTGSWYEARVALDPTASEELPPELRQRVADRLAPARRLGHDVRAVAADYVPIELALRVCVAPGYLRGHVLADVLGRLSDRVLPDNSLGFFHPDRLSFGQSICESAVVAAVQAANGVESVTVDVLRRLEHPTASTRPEGGTLVLRAHEIAQLAGDPDFPERGSIKIAIGGGR